MQEYFLINIVKYYFENKIPDKSEKDKSKLHTNVVNTDVKILNKMLVHEIQQYHI